MKRREEMEKKRWALVLLVLIFSAVISCGRHNEPPQPTVKIDKKKAEAEIKAVEVAVTAATPEELIDLIVWGKTHASKLAWEKVKEKVATKGLIYITARTKNQDVCQEAWQMLTFRGQKNLFFTEEHGRKWGAWIYIVAFTIDPDISLAAWKKAKETKQSNRISTEVLGASHPTVRAEASKLWEATNPDWRTWDKSGLERIYWNAENAPLGSKIKEELKRRRIIEKAMR